MRSRATSRKVGNAAGVGVKVGSGVGVSGRAKVGTGEGDRVGGTIRVGVVVGTNVGTGVARYTTITAVRAPNRSASLDIARSTGAGRP